MSRLLTMNNLQIEGYQEDRWQPIVNDVSVTLERGEILGLIGESGAGKSTIGIAAMGLHGQGAGLLAATLTLTVLICAAPQQNSSGPCGARGLPMWHKARRRPLTPPIRFWSSAARRQSSTIF